MVPAGSGGLRGGFSSGGPDHVQEKSDGKKSAIAETIAMMNKMKMEDKERKESHQKHVEARKRGMGEESQEFNSSPEDELPQVNSVVIYYVFLSYLKQTFLFTLQCWKRDFTRLWSGQICKY